MVPTVFAEFAAPEGLPGVLAAAEQTLQDVERRCTASIRSSCTEPWLAR